MSQRAYEVKVLHPLPPPMLFRVLPGAQCLRIWPLPPVWMWLVPWLKSHFRRRCTSALRKPFSCSERLQGSGAPAPGEAPGFSHVPSHDGELPALLRCPHSAALSGLRSKRKTAKIPLWTFSWVVAFASKDSEKPGSHICPTASFFWSHLQPVTNRSNGSSESGAFGPGAALAVCSDPYPSRGSMVTLISDSGCISSPGKGFRRSKLRGALCTSVPGWIHVSGRGIG